MCFVVGTRAAESVQHHIAACCLIVCCAHVTCVSIVNDNSCCEFYWVRDCGWRVGALIDDARFRGELLVNDDCDSAYDAGACEPLHCDGA